jgi:hypothetical protein
VSNPKYNGYEIRCDNCPWGDPVRRSSQPGKATVVACHHSSRGGDSNPAMSADWWCSAHPAAEEAIRSVTNDLDALGWLLSQSSAPGKPEAGEA